MIERRCCVCGLHLGTIHDDRHEIRVSHGYCSPCLAAWMAKMEELDADLPRPARWVEVRRGMASRETP